MGADKLNINVRYEVTLRRCAYAQTIKDADNPSEKITELLTQLITDTRARCIKEMEHDCVLTYTVVEDFSIVNYSKLRQMGLALAIVRKLNKEAKRFTPVVVFITTQISLDYTRLQSVLKPRENGGSFN